MLRIPKSIKSTRQLLEGPNHILHSLYAQTRQLLAIEQQVKAYVEDDISVASLKNNELTLMTTSGALATRLRYRQRNIIDSLQRSGMHVSALKIKVQPVTTPPKQVTVARRISSENARCLAEAAAHIQDEPLRKILIQLSRRAD